MTDSKANDLGRNVAHLRGQAEALWKSQERRNAAVDHELEQLWKTYNELRNRTSEIEKVQSKHVGVIIGAVALLSLVGTIAGLFIHDAIAR